MLIYHPELVAVVKTVLSLNANHFPSIKANEVQRL